MMPPVPRDLGSDATGGAYLFAALLGLVVWLPIPLGSNRPWSAALMEGVALSLLGTWFVRSLLRPMGLPAPVRSARAPLALLGAWLAYLLLQALPLPEAMRGLPGVVGSPYDLLATVVGDPVAVTLSVDRGATLAAFLKACAYLSMYVLVLVLAANRRRLSVLGWVLVAVGVGESLVGLSVYLAGISAQVASGGLFDRAGVAGTYVNRNHFAGLLEMTTAMALGMYLASSGEAAGSRGLRAWLRRASRAWLGVRGILAFCLLLMVAALLLSASRGAIGAFGLALLIVSVLSASRSRSWREAGRTAGVVVVIAAVAGAWLGMGNLPAKVAQEGLASNRGDIREVTYEMIAQRWIFGSGAGTYRLVFPEHQDERFRGLYYEHAHNDYLETLSEQGVVGALLLGSALLWLLWRIARALHARRHPRWRGILFGSLLGCLSLAIHGVMDFNFQIPANAAYFMILLAVGTVASQLERSRDRSLVRPRERPRPRIVEERETDSGAAASLPGDPRRARPA